MEVQKEDMELEEEAGFSDLNCWARFAHLA